MADVKPEADVLEQQLPLYEDEPAEVQPVIAADVPEADAIEQAQVVPGDIDDEIR